MKMDEPTENKGVMYEFGGFMLDPRQRVLLRDGQSVHLPDKVFDTLLLLVEHNGRLLTKDEMMTTLWTEAFVEEGNLTKTISRLRKILNINGQSFIETLPKHGYRFCGDVREIDGQANLLVHRHLHVQVSQVVETVETQHDSNSLNRIESFAILPFQPLGSSPVGSLSGDDYFGLGITDALITQLSRTGQVKVCPTSSILKYNSREQEPVLAGRELQVDGILEGKFQRSGNKLRLTVQMLRTIDGGLLWADSFNAEIEDIFTIQDSIAGQVIRALNAKISGEPEERLKKRDTENFAAYEEYLKGRFFWNKRPATKYQEALKCFQKAIEIDPQYALAYAGLAEIYNIFPFYDGYAPQDYFPKAKAAALNALSIDPHLPEAHAALGLAMLHYDWNWAGAEVSYQYAIKLDPHYSRGYELLGVYQLRVNRLGDAIATLKKAQELDPRSPINMTWLGEVFRSSGEPEAAAWLHEETLKTFPDFYLSHYHLAFCHLDSGRLDQAELHCQKAVSLSNAISLTLSLQGILQAASGNTSAARETLGKLLEMKAEKYISSVNIASVYSALGDDTNAIDWLERALVERDPNLTWLKSDKEFDFLEENPRFQKILEDVGLAQRKVRIAEAPEIKGKALSSLSDLWRWLRLKS